MSTLGPQVASYNFQGASGGSVGPSDMSPFYFGNISSLEG